GAQMKVTAAPTILMLQDRHVPGSGRGTERVVRSFAGVKVAPTGDGPHGGIVGGQVDPVVKVIVLRFSKGRGYAGVGRRSTANDRPFEAGLLLRCRLDGRAGTGKGGRGPDQKGGGGQGPGKHRMDRGASDGRKI